MTQDLLDTATRLLRSGVAASDFPQALAGEPAQDMLRRALDPDDRSIGVVAWKGQRLADDLRAGDVLLRHGPTRAPRIAVILDPTPLGAGAMRRLGVVTEGPLPGRYVRVIEPGSSGPMGFARRVTGPDGLMLHDTVILRRAEASENVVSPPGPHPTIRRGSGGPAVSEAQTKLNRVHTARQPLDRCPLAIDGIFGPNTGAATLSFQRFAFAGQPNEWDGVIGPRTWAMLDTYARNDVPAEIPPDIPPIVPISSVVLQPDRWLSILRGSANAPTTTQNAVKALVDGTATYGAMADDVAAARGDRAFIYLLGWDMYDNFPLRRGDCTATLNALLTAAVARGVQVRAMVWDNLSKPLVIRDNIARINALSNGGGIVDGRNGGTVPITAAQVNTIMQMAAGVLALARLDPAVEREWRRIRDEITRKLRGITAAHHQKVLLVYDGERLVAYCGGLDLNPNRVMPDITSCGSGSHGPVGASDPQHDTHCRIVGPATRELLRTFVERWLDHPNGRAIDIAKGTLRGDPVTSIPAPPIPNPSPRDAPFGGSASVIVARTWNPVSGSTRPPRQRDIGRLLLTAIANARRFIYIEDQYLIDLATARALNRVIDRLNHVTVLLPGNEISGGLIFPQFYRQQFIDTVTAGKSPDVAAKLRVFQLNKPRGSAPNSFGRESYVHSKCWVIDDELAVIGSANCNRRGYQHDSEIDAFIFDDAVSGPPILTALRGESAETSASGLTFAQQFRMRLWSEHLGLPAPSDGTDVSQWPGFSTPAVPNPALGVARFDPVHPPHHPIINRAIAIVAPLLLDLVDPASP